MQAFLFHVSNSDSLSRNNLHSILYLLRLFTHGIQPHWLWSSMLGIILSCGFEVTLCRSGAQQRELCVNMVLTCCASLGVEVDY